MIETSHDSFYINCDKLEDLPKTNRDNYLFELDLLERELPKSASVLQVGCMDGTRIAMLLEKRADLQVTGLDIEAHLLKIAEERFRNSDMNVRLIEADITKAQMDERFDFVLCLNNTLGYITDFSLAVARMTALGNTTIISVFGEKFTDEAGREYFSAIGAPVEKIERNVFHFGDFGDVKRFTRGEVEQWNGRIVQTPLGYYCRIV